MNRKKKGLIILWVSIFIAFSSFVFFMIGNNKGILISDIVRRLFLGIFILACLAIIVGIYLMVRNKRRYLFKKWVNWLVSILVGVYAVGCTSFLILLYGPNNTFRDWLITTAMATMHHQYLCQWFYGDDIIAKVMGNNYIDDGGAETDPTLVDHEIKDTDKYENKYERDVLERDKDALYKIVKLTVSDCDAFLAVIYDPSKIRVTLSSQINEHGQWPMTISKNAKAALSINGGGYSNAPGDTTGGIPIGITIANNKIYSNARIPEGGYWGLIGFNQDNTLVLLKNVTAQSALDMGVRDGVTMGPFLIVNGKPSKFSGNGGWGVAARTAIGQRKDGIVLFLVVNSNHNRTKGATIVELLEVMQNYGAVNAANLDGGTSSVMILPEEEAIKYSVCEGSKCCSTAPGTKHCIINNPIDSAGRKQSRGMPTLFSVIP